MSDNKEIKPQAFEVDDRFQIRIDRALAINLGILILSTDTKNPALLALGHKLRDTRETHNELVN